MTLRDFSRDFNKNFNQIADSLTESLEQFTIDCIQQVPSPKAKKVLSYALDLLRPHFLSLGVRVSVLSPLRLELILPAKPRVVDSDGNIFLGVQTSAAVEGYRMWWRRNLPVNLAKQGCEVRLLQVHTRVHKSCNQDLRLRGEVSEISRESCLAELLQNKKSKHQMTIYCVDSENQICTELDIECELLNKDLLTWTAADKAKG